MSVNVTTLTWECFAPTLKLLASGKLGSLSVLASNLSVNLADFFRITEVFPT